MPYHLQYHPDVKKKDLPKLNNTMKKRIKTSIEQRLVTAPEKYTEPLRRTLKSYRKLGVGDYWIAVKIANNEIIILGIC